MDKVSMSHVFSFSRYQTKCVIKFSTVDDIINFKIFLGLTSKAMADSERKGGRRKYKNLSMSRTKRAFEIK